MVGKKLELSCAGLALTSALLSACSQPQTCAKSPAQAMQQLLSAYQNKDRKQVVRSIDFEYLARVSSANSRKTYTAKRLKQSLLKKYSKSGYPPHWQKHCRYIIKRDSNVIAFARFTCRNRFGRDEFSFYTLFKTDCGWRVGGYTHFRAKSLTPFMIRMDDEYKESLKHQLKPD